MRASCVNLDPDTPLFPPEVRQWVPPDPLVHCIMAAAGELERGDEREGRLHLFAAPAAA